MIPPSRRRGDVRRGALVTTTLATSLVLATMGAAPAAVPATVPTVESATERVLQSVAVTMGPDGTTTGVGSSVVRTAGSVEDAETTDESYSPQEVVADLPVRVLTSWRTSEGAGTDLADLQGYTGRVAIDVTVQNLTVRPEMLTYDAAGTARQQAALVGSPLTVTASTSLGDLKADRVVTDDQGSGTNVTNGVLGRGAEGTSVQWAALLAPPILKSSSEFSLVLDAKDFDVPTIDLSVQPGLVTDPSMGALVDSAFNPARSGELDLQRRTIELIGEVNLVLSRASDTISEVRTSLTSSAETLGTQTVADLQSSTQSVSSNMSQLDGALRSLQGDLNSTLEATGSNAVAELQQAVVAVDKLLGDTSAQPPTVGISGSGCETAVAGPKQTDTVYGSLLQVAGQLGGYAKATDACRGALRDSILETIGDRDADATTCEPTDASITCSLVETRSAFAEAADELETELLETLGLIKPELYEAAVDAAEALMAQAETLEGISEEVSNRRVDLLESMRDARDALSRNGETGRALGALESALGDIHVDAQSVADRDTANAAVLCDVIATALPPDRQRLEQVRRSLVDYDCGETDPAELTINDDVQGILDSSRTTATDTQPLVGAGAALAAVRTTTEETSAAIEAALNSRGPDGTGKTFQELFDEVLLPAFDVLADRREDLGEEIKNIQDLEAQVAQISTGITTGIANAQAKANKSLDGTADKIVEAGDDATGELSQMFDRSVNGLKSASDTVVQDGRKQIDAQKKGFLAAQEQAARNVTDSVEQGLGQINSGVSSSTRDMEAATTLLTADLRKVLLDLGQRRVGGGGLLGAMATNAATARTADYQLALAGDKATSYSNVRSRDIDGLMLRQAQTDAAMQMLLDMPAFQLDLPSGSQHRTVYSFRIGDS